MQQKAIRRSAQREIDVQGYVNLKRVEIKNWLNTNSKTAEYLMSVKLRRGQIIRLHWLLVLVGIMAGMAQVSVIMTLAIAFYAILVLRKFMREDMRENWRGGDDDR